jgi:hypothetical protein
MRVHQSKDMRRRAPQRTGERELALAPLFICLSLPGPVLCKLGQPGVLLVLPEVLSPVLMTFAMGGVPHAGSWHTLSRLLTLCSVNNDIADLGTTGPGHPLGHGLLLCISYYISCRSPAPAARDSTWREGRCQRVTMQPLNFLGLCIYFKFKIFFYTFRKALVQRFDIFSSPSSRFIISKNHCCPSEFLLQQFSRNQLYHLLSTSSYVPYS